MYNLVNALRPAGLACIVTLLQCQLPASQAHLPHDARGAFTDAGSPPVVLIAIDGVRWQEIYRGVDPALARAAGLGNDEHTSAAELMPNLWGLIEKRGVALGHPDLEGRVEATGPNYLSMPGYTEMLTGRAPTSCPDNGCRPRLPGTLADEFRAIEGARDGDVAVISSWERIEHIAAANPGRIVVSTGREGGVTRDRLRQDPESSALLDEAARAAPWPGTADFRPDRYTAAIGLRYLAQSRPRFLFLGLGEPDEFGHHGDYRGYLASLRHVDHVLGEVVKTLDTMAETGRRPLLFITTDHGRSHGFRDHGEESPESRTVWMVAAGGDIPALGVIPLSRTRHLADLGPTLRALAGLPPDTAPGAGSAIAEIVDPARRNALAPVAAAVMPRGLARAPGNRRAW